MTRLFVAIPCYKGVVAAYHALSLVALEMTRPADVEMRVAFKRGVGDISDARSILVAEALAWGATHLVFIDDDISFDPETVWRMLERSEHCPVQCTIAQKRNDVWNGELAMSVPLQWLQIDIENMLAVTDRPVASFGLGMIRTDIFNHEIMYNVSQYIALGASEAAKFYVRDYFGVSLVEAPENTLQRNEAIKYLIPGKLTRRGEDYAFAQLCFDAQISIVFDLAAKLVHWEGNIAHDCCMEDILREQGLIS